MPKTPREDVATENAPADAVTKDCLMEERNILQLEGSLFCFDPREAKRAGPLLFHADSARPVTVIPDAIYGRPQGLAYKTLQAIFLKVVAEGYPYPEQVVFSKRELTRLVGWKGHYGGWQGRQFYEAIMQLHTTRIHCFFYNSNTKEWKETSFYILPRVLFSGKDIEISHCLVYIDPQIVQSLTRRHVVFFNLHRLSTLDPMGMVLYKRIFFHLSNLSHQRTPNDKLVLHKDYEDVCREWLGGLKPERYPSRIDKQLGKRFRAITRTGLTRCCGVEKRASGGFKLVACPGKGFFEDYEAYYGTKQPQLQFRRAEAVRYVQQPLELVAYFHERMGHTHNHFKNHEMLLAAELLKTHSYADLCDLVDYAVVRARETNFAMQFFGAAKQYLEPWTSDRARRAEREKRLAAVKACPHCDESGRIVLRNAAGAFRAMACPHDYAQIEAFERRGLFWS